MIVNRFTCYCVVRVGTFGNMSKKTKLKVIKEKATERSFSITVHFDGVALATLNVPPDQVKRSLEVLCEALNKAGVRATVT